MIRFLDGFSQIALLCGFLLVGFSVTAGWPALLGGVCSVAASFGLLILANRRRKERFYASSGGTKT